ncbi:hypothetical protein PIB30_115128, partial [Stylosanthes scabra]|nr:hypothetical protein [Stylosanthes scabra]
MNEACGSLCHVWACLDVTLECELLASHAYAWASMPRRGQSCLGVESPRVARIPRICME